MTLIRKPSSKGQVVHETAITAYRDSRGTTVDEYSKLCWVISTADGYSPESVEYSKENDVRLLNGKQFVEMLLEAGIDGLDQALNK